MTAINIILFVAGIYLMVFTFVMHILTDKKEPIYSIVALYLVSLFGIGSGLNELLLKWG
jgi:hypothetical protein